MKIVKRTDAYTIFLRGDKRYAVKDAEKNAVNGEEKVRILLEEGLIQTAPPPAPEPEASEEAEAPEEAASEAAAEEPAAEEEAAASEAPAADNASEESEEEKQ
jgi:hypothetical protein